MDRHAISTTGRVMMVVLLTFSNPNVKCVKMVSTTQTVPEDVVIARMDKRVIRKVEIVSTVAVQTSKNLCVKNAKMDFTTVIVAPNVENV